MSKDGCLNLWDHFSHGVAFHTTTQNVLNDKIQIGLHTFLK